MAVSLLSLPLLALLATLPFPTTSQRCLSRALGKEFSHGEVWTEPPCMRMTCDGGLTRGQGCTLATYSPSSGCVEVKGTPGAKYPTCCNRVKCPRSDQCFSMPLKKTFNDGDIWTEPQCEKYECLQGISKGLLCPRYKIRAGCKMVNGTPGSDYPACCARPECPKPAQCYSQRLGKVFNNDQEWTEPPCHSFRCKNGVVEGTTCPKYQFSGCVKKEGVPGAKYPGCCATITCPKAGQCYSEKLKTILDNGKTWTEPTTCGLFKCNNGRVEVAVCPQLTVRPGCVKEEGRAGASFPDCCPQTVCPRSDQCRSAKLGRTFDEGESWTEPPCQSYTCKNGKAKKQEDCPPLKLESGCVKEFGTPGAQFPACCDKAKCRSTTRCYSHGKSKFFNNGESWTADPCALYTCNNGSIKLTACPVHFDWDDCKFIKGDLNAQFPQCCNRVECPKDDDCYSKQLDKTFKHGDTWTERPCKKVKCNTGIAEATDCPWDTGFNCKKIGPGIPGAEFPKCCEQYKCDDFGDFK